jgi:hypothetical protein
VARGGTRELYAAAGKAGAASAARAWLVDGRSEISGRVSYGASRACPGCRAGFAGRGMLRARATGCHILGSP